ncbi:Self-incompatibility protein [Trema orientale]|uniref:S-protein homolog n=1 Tax=Trema orientale TaxID=63057 RepID=A0A2P5CYH9_TREOI|nr:Self-incompatibility protein [Trema orientale]
MATTTSTTPLFLVQFLLLLLLYLIFSTNWPMSTSANMVTKYHIHVINDLPESSTKLSVHCKSGDDDKGMQELSWNEEYVWGTRINFFRTTLYFCYIQWLGVKERYFVAFKAKRDEVRCEKMKNCLWRVRRNGVYFSNDNSTWFMEYPW